MTTFKSGGHSETDVSDLEITDAHYRRKFKGSDVKDEDEQWALGRIKMKRRQLKKPAMGNSSSSKANVRVREDAV